MKTRSSTSGGVAMIGWTPLRHWSNTQSTVSLSSAEAELKALIKGAIEGIYFKHLLQGQTGETYTLQLWSDSSSAKSILERLGPGKRAKHIEIQSYWLQQVVRDKKIEVKKIWTTSNPADGLTKHIPRGAINGFSRQLGYSYPEEIDVKHKEWINLKKDYNEEKKRSANNKADLSWTWEGDSPQDIEDAETLEHSLDLMQGLV